MSHRADDRNLVGDTGDLRQPFTKADSRKTGWYRLQFALDFGRSVRLGIEGLMLRRGAVQEKKDASLGFPKLSGNMRHGR